MTILAIALGVGILTGVNVTADSIEQAVNIEIYSKLGENDIIIRTNRSVDGGWFNYQDSRNLIRSVDGVEKIVPRIIKSNPSYPILNHTGGWNVPTVALNTQDPNEKYFGNSNITDSLDTSLINSSKIEDLFQTYSHLDLPVVISQSYANKFNLSSGDSIYIFPELSEGMDRHNTSTWLEGTIIGLINDISLSVQDYSPPAKVWQLYPPSDAIYIDLNDAWEYVFNANKDNVNFLFVNVKDIGSVEEIRQNINSLDDSNSIFPGGIFTENAKGLFTEGILQVNFLMRGIFSIFSAISLLVCALIIKNLLEMSKEENTHEIGVMRAVGVTKRKILSIYVAQILFISVVGGLFGLLFGYFISSIFVGSYVDTATAVGTDFSKYALTPVMTWQTILIGMSSGVVVSIIFGLIPARSAANVDPLDALHSKTDKPKKSLAVRTLKGTGRLSLGIGFTVGGSILVGSAFGGLFLADIINPQIIVMVFVGVLLLIVGIILLAAFIFPIIVPIMANLFYPILKKMRIITGRNLKRYSKQTKNTFAMLSIGLSMMITVGTIMNSAFVGAYPGGRTIVGGDIRIGNFDRGQIQIGDHTQGLSNLPSVEYAVPMRFSLGIEGLNRLENLETNRTFGGKQDSFAGVVQESLHIGIFNPIDYSKIHAEDSIIQLRDRNVKFVDLMRELEDPYTIVLQGRLSRRIGGIETDDMVRIRFDGFEADFRVIGLFDVLPGFYWSYFEMDNPFDKQFCGGISWNSYNQMIDDNFGKIDVIAKNNIQPPPEYTENLDVPDDNIWGYLNTPIDYTTLEYLAYETGLVQNTTRRITSPFWATPTFAWETNLTTFDSNINLSDYFSTPADEATFSLEISEVFNETLALQNVLWHESGSISPNWNDMMSKSVVIDPDHDDDFGNTRITQTLSNIPLEKRNSIEDIFNWAEENYDNPNWCIANEIYVNLDLTSGTVDYIKRIVPGDTLRIFYNDTLYIDFDVIATTNSHYNYEFVDNNGNHFGDTAVFNYKSMSFNSALYNTSDWGYFFEVIDAEPNTVFLPYNISIFPEELTSDIIPSLIENYLYGDLSESNGESDTDLLIFNSDWINQTLGQMFWLNDSQYQGELETSQWVGNYSFDGNTFSFDGAVFQLQGEEQLINISIPISNGTQILQSIANGSRPLELDDFTSLMYFNLNDSMNYEDIKVFIDTMNHICKTIPTLENITFFSPRLFLLEESMLYRVYFFIGTENQNKISDALYEIENYYISNGLGWEKRWVERANEQQEDVGGFLSLVVTMFFGVLSFALIVSLVGLAISTIISIKKRHAEIGTLRTLGFSKKQILKMVVGEGIITAIYGIVVGLITGITIALLVIQNLPFMIFLPLIFTPPYALIFQGIGLLILAATLVSFMPGMSAIKIDISEAIRSKGE